MEKERNRKTKIKKERKVRKKKKEEKNKFTKKINNNTIIINANRFIKMIKESVSKPSLSLSS
jgi:hypothetical protein